MLTRPYRGTMQKSLDLDFLWLALAAYGFVGIFMRLFADYFAYNFQSRKAFLYLAIIIEFATFIPVIIDPSTTTNVIQALGVGVGASCIGSFELLFKEQYGKSKVYLTVSILSIPPLLANFLTAPIQSVVSSASMIDGSRDVDILKYLWLIGLCFIVIAFLMLFFVKENQYYFGLVNQTKRVSSPKQKWQYLIIALIGFMIMFVKFSNSGSVGLLHLQMLGQLSNEATSAYEGYLSVIFSLAQLVAGILMGTYLIKKWSIHQIFSLGVGLWILYHIVVIFNPSPYAYMVIHSLNGFSYGILYNLILAIVLSYSFNTKKITPMGMYQSILSIGITVSALFTGWLKGDVLNINQSLISYMHINGILNIVLIAACVVMAGLYYLLYRSNDTNKPDQRWYL